MAFLAGRRFAIALLVAHCICGNQMAARVRRHLAPIAARRISPAFQRGVRGHAESRCLTCPVAVLRTDRRPRHRGRPPSGESVFNVTFASPLSTLDNSCLLKPAIMLKRALVSLCASRSALTLRPTSSLSSSVLWVISNFFIPNPFYWGLTCSTHWNSI